MNDDFLEWARKTFTITDESHEEALGYYDDTTDNDTYQLAYLFLAVFENNPYGSDNEVVCFEGYINVSLFLDVWPKYFAWRQSQAMQPETVQPEGQ